MTPTSALVTAPPNGLGLHLLGGAVIRSNGEPLGGPAAHRHRLALLAFLAASPGPVSRDKLIAMLWPERDEESGRNLLKVAVHELRKVIGEQALRSTGDQLSLDSTAFWCDLVAFRAALADDPERAVGLYAGPFLDGFFLKDSAEFERWSETHRNQIATEYEEALRDLASAAERNGVSSVTWWKKLAAQDPVRADIALNLMRSLAADGDRDGALRHAEIHASLRSKDFGLEPEPSVAALAAELSSSPAAIAIKRPVAAYTPEVKRLPELERSHLSTRRPVKLTALALILTLTPIVVWQVARGASARIDAAAKGRPASVSVLPFRVSGVDTALSTGLREMLVARFGSDGPVSAIENRSRASTIDQAITEARSLNDTYALLGDAVGGGAQGGVELTATVYRVATGEAVASATRSVPRAAPIAPAVDTLAAELMSRVAREPEDRLADLTHRSLPALRPYLAAQTAYRTGQYQRAESLFAKSLSTDSTFALAGLGLTLANSWNTINEHYGIGRDAALRNQASLSARDRAFIAAFFASDPAVNKAKPAPAYLDAWEDVVHKWPDFAEAWYNLGDRYYHFGGLSGLADPLDQARTAFRRAMAVDSEMAAPLHHLIEIYASRGEKADAYLTGERYFARNPSVSRDASAIAWEIATVTQDRSWLARLRANFDKMSLADLARIAWVTQDNNWPTADADSALTVFEKRASATWERLHAHALRFAFELNDGHTDKALGAARAAESLLPDQPIEALWGTYAVIYGGSDSAGEGARIDRLKAFATGPLSGDNDRKIRQMEARCLVGQWMIQQGNLSGARAIVRELTSQVTAADALHNREGRMCEAALGASIAVAEGSAGARAAVARLDTLVLRERIPPRMSLTAEAILSARLHEQLGQRDLALAASRWREHYTGDPFFLSTQRAIERTILDGDKAK